MNCAETKKLPTFKVLIKSDLKKEGRDEILKKIVSVRYSSFSMGDSVDVETLDLTKSEREHMKTLLNSYKSGHFNSMEDIFEYKSVQSKTRTAKYVSLNNRFSENTKKLVMKLLEDQGIVDNSTAYQIRKTDYDQLLWEELNKLEKI